MYCISFIYYLSIQYILIRLLLGLLVNVHVSLQIHGVDEFLIALVTSHYFLSTVKQHVCLEVITACKCRITFFALVLLLIVMACYMTLEVCTLNKCTVTDFTLVPFVTCKIKCIECKNTDISWPFYATKSFSIAFFLMSDKPQLISHDKVLASLFEFYSPKFKTITSVTLWEYSLAYLSLSQKCSLVLSHSGPFFV